jgi:hypothetical protein
VNPTRSNVRPLAAELSVEAKRRRDIIRSAPHAKRGARAEHVSLDTDAVIHADRSDDFVSLDDALNTLAKRLDRELTGGTVDGSRTLDARR